MTDVHEVALQFHYIHCPIVGIQKKHTDCVLF